MNRKKAVTVLLLAFVAVSVSFLAFKELRPGTPVGMSAAAAMEKKAGNAEDSAGPGQKGHQVIA
ncbi:hypothetical protein EG829_27620, partial [bacterium]|nr:hypothetical protein [bacterium]